MCFDGRHVSGERIPASVDRLFYWSTLSCIFLTGVLEQAPPPKKSVPNLFPEPPPFPQPTTLPPPGQTSPPPSAATGIVIDGKRIRGTEGLDPAAVGEEVLRGGRFVLFPYCFSILILTFRRATNVRFLRAGEDGGGTAIGCSIFTLLFGWWGIPWGPIWTISSLITNARGGKDVTGPVLNGLLPAAAATAIMQQRRRSGAGPLLWGLRLALLAAPVLIVALITSMIREGKQRDASDAKTRGSAEFEAANDRVDRFAGSAAAGNCPVAKQIAADVSAAMKEQRDALFSKGKESAHSATQGEFLTWCDLREDRCIVLVHVPELRRYKEEAQKQMCELAWATASVYAERHIPQRKDLTLAVGVRGLGLFERVMIGKLGGDPAETLRHSEGKRRLFELFAPPDQAAE